MIFFFQSCLFSQSNYIEGLWGENGSYIKISSDSVIFFDYISEIGCYKTLEFEYINSDLENSIKIIADSYYGYTFDVQVFVDSNGNLNILPPYEQDYDVIPLELNKTISNFNTCLDVDYTQMVGQWLLSKKNDFNNSKNELNYMEIFNDGTILKYNYDLENNCYQISQLSISFVNSYGEGVVFDQYNTERDIIAFFDIDENLVFFLEGSEEIWIPSTFDTDKFINIECGNINLNDFSYFDVLIYPNPSKESLFIEASIPGIFVLEIINIDGKKILSYNFKNSCKVDISLLSKGVYLARVFDQEKSIIKTVYIE